MPKLLIIDDEPNVRFTLREIFEGEKLCVMEASTPQEALRLAAQESPDLVLLDIWLGDHSGLDVFHELRKIDPKVLVIFITGHGSTETAIEAMKLGAYDYMVKPLDVGQLLQVVDQALAISRLMHVPAVVEDGARPEERPDILIGSGPAMQTVCKQIGRVAPQDVNVLILGKSGTGKELVARALYHHSRRNQAAFLAINCAAIPESLLESELFGHERGAFTGADRRRIGKFEQCHGGTIFLDEVGDMAPHTQAKILRLLQERRFERVGGSESITADVRILAATNQDLETLIAQGAFREDLYYRLRGVTIRLPALCQRREDIAELAHYFLFRYNRQLGTTVQSISAEAMEMLRAYDWPGNVRELQNVIREALIVSAGPTILPDFLPLELQQRGDAGPEAEAKWILSESAAPTLRNDWSCLLQDIEAWIDGGQTDVYRRARERFDRMIILRAMQQADNNQHRAADILGLSRVTIRARLRGANSAGGKAEEPSEPPSGSP